MPAHESGKPGNCDFHFFTFSKCASVGSQGRSLVYALRCRQHYRFVFSAHDVFKLQLTPAEYRKRFLVKKGSRSLSVEIDEIAYFFIEESVSHFRNKQGQRFVVDYRMDELAEILDPNRFFRINRGINLTHQSVIQISQYFNNRLSLVLKPAFDKEAIVSREKANDFKV